MQADGIALGDPFTPGTSQRLSEHLVILSYNLFLGIGDTSDGGELLFSSSNFGMRLIYEISTIALLGCCA